MRPPDTEGLLGERGPLGPQGPPPGVPLVLPAVCPPQLGPVLRGGLLCPLQASVIRAGEQQILGWAGPRWPGGGRSSGPEELSAGRGSPDADIAHTERTLVCAAQTEQERVCVLGGAPPASQEGWRPAPLLAQQLPGAVVRGAVTVVSPGSPISHLPSVLPGAAVRHDHKPGAVKNNRSLPLPVLEPESEVKVLAPSPASFYNTSHCI